MMSSGIDSDLCSQIVDNPIPEVSNCESVATNLLNEWVPSTTVNPLILNLALPQSSFMPILPNTGIPDLLGLSTANIPDVNNKNVDIPHPNRDVFSEDLLNSMDADKKIEVIKKIIQSNSKQSDELKSKVANLINQNLSLKNTVETKKKNKPRAIRPKKDLPSKTPSIKNNPKSSKPNKSKVKKVMPKIDQSSISPPRSVSQVQEDISNDPILNMAHTELLKDIEKKKSLTMKKDASARLKKNMNKESEKANLSVSDSDGLPFSEAAVPVNKCMLDLLDDLEKTTTALSKELTIE